MSKLAKPNDAPPTLWQVTKSVAAAFFGVQSEQNRQRDFTRGKPMQFIIIGLAATAVFVVTMILIVKLILRFAVG